MGCSLPTSLLLVASASAAAAEACDSHLTALDAASTRLHNAAYGESYEPGYVREEDFGAQVAALAFAPDAVVESRMIKALEEIDLAMELAREAGPDRYGKRNMGAFLTSSSAFYRCLKGSATGRNAEVWSQLRDAERWTRADVKRTVGVTLDIGDPL